MVARALRARGSFVFESTIEVARAVRARRTGHSCRVRRLPTEEGIRRLTAAATGILLPTAGPTATLQSLSVAHAKEVKTRGRARGKPEACP